MPAPPPSVLTGVLRGGPYDGIVVEIAASAPTIELAHLIAFGPGASDARTARGVSPYRYTGEIDDQGNAVYSIGHRS